MSEEGVGSPGVSSAASGASGNDDRPSEGDTAPVLRAPRFRGQIGPVIPCSVNQLLTATWVGSVFMVRGVLVSKVSIVGIIRKAEGAGSYIDYEIDDMSTKPMVARHWLRRGPGNQALTPCPVGVYAKVIGSLRGTANVKTLEVIHIRVLTDMNEVTVQIQDTVREHMRLFQPQQAGSGDQAPEHGETGPEFIQKQVLRWIRGCRRQEGKSVGELQTELRSLSPEAIKEALECLKVQGYIYPTVDGEHFKSAD